MKIAFFHELHYGGARRASNEFAKVLRGKHSVDLYILDEVRDKKEDVFYDRIRYYNFKSKKWSGGNWKVKLYKDTVELLNLNKVHKKIAKVIDQKKYDIILVFPSQFTQAPFLLKYLQTKSVFFAMEPLRLVYDPENRIPNGLDLFRYSYERLNRFNRKLLDKNNIDHADHIVAPSKFSAAFSSQVYKKRVDVAYLGVKTSFFTTDKRKRDIDILFVGSKDSVNGYEFYKDVLNKIKSKVKTREVLTENEWLTDVQIRELYRRSKILVATSYNELLGLIPLEAMGCGVVVLAVDEAGYRETIINGKNGFLIQRKDIAFAEKIDYLLKKIKILMHMSQFASQNFHETWDWKSRGKELEKLLENY